MAEFIFEHMVVLWVMLAVIVFVCLFSIPLPMAGMLQRPYRLLLKVRLRLGADGNAGFAGVYCLFYRHRWVFHHYSNRFTGDLASALCPRAFIYPFTMRSSEKPLVVWIGQRIRLQPDKCLFERLLYHHESAALSLKLAHGSRALLSGC